MREPSIDSVQTLTPCQQATHSNPVIFFSSAAFFSAAFFLVLLTLLASPAWGQAATLMETPLAGPAPPLEDACSEGVVRDDGNFETGFGWVPSVIEGIYVQAYDVSEIAQPAIEKTCICFSRTREDSSISFEVVFYRDNDGNPEETPFAAFPTLLEDVPEGVVGKFAEVETPVTLPTTGTVYIGARWDASEDVFFFLCDDTTETTERVNAWFRDDRAEGWDNVFETPDSIFLVHRAFLIRPVGSLAPLTDIPTLGNVGVGLLAALLLAAGIWRFRSGS